MLFHSCSHVDTWYLAVKDNRAPLAPSTVDWFFLRPWLEYVVGSVVSDVCHLVLGVARAGAIYGDEQNDSTLSTIQGEPGGAGTAGLWPRCDVKELLHHAERSDSRAQ